MAQRRTTLESDRQVLRDLFQVGLSAVAAGPAVTRYFERGTFPRPQSNSHRIFVLAIGKAAAPMAAAAEAWLLEHAKAQYGDGLVVTKDGHAEGVALERMRILEAAHPIPDERGLRATEAVGRFLIGLQAGDVLFVLLSGGASALLPAPPPGVTLEEKQALTAALLRSGAPIQDINTIRRMSSRLKGGRLRTRAKGARVITLAISDVPGDSPVFIGSGPTVPEIVTMENLWEIVDRYALRSLVTPALAKYWEQMIATETPTAAQVEAARRDVEILASNQIAREAILTEAARLGITAIPAPTFLTGSIEEAADVWNSERKASVARVPVGTMGVLFVGGGEPTVKVHGKGLGGRNQELALRLALLAASESLNSPFTFLSAGTDGTDGPTPAAGAFADETSIQRGQQEGLDAQVFLAENNSYRYWEALGDLLITGPTGTNVMDIHLLLRLAK